jgi:hypothetical protein
MNQPFAPRSTDFPPIPRDDSVLILTHLQNDFWHPNGAFHALTEATLPHPDVLQCILGGYASLPGQRYTAYFSQ